MKTRNLIFVFGVALVVSLGVFSNTKSFQIAKATVSQDIGTVAVGVNKSNSNSRNIYLIPTNEIDLPDDASNSYSPVGDESGIFVNGEKNTGSLVFKTVSGTKQFYFSVNPRAREGTTVEFKGDWTATIGGTTYNFTFKTYSIQYINSKWESTAELEPYDSVTLSDTCFDDQYCQSFDSTYLYPGPWNTYIPSEDNTRKNFSFSFYFESYGDMTTELSIKAGNDAPYDEGHFYRLSLNNTWGGSSGGVIFLAEIIDGVQQYRTPDLLADLKPGARHLIEFGSIYYEDSDDTYNFVKYDGAILSEETRTPFSHERTTKIGYYYGGNNIFFGSTKSTQIENTQILKYGFLSEDKGGIYFDGAINDIPSGWDIKGVPASKYNLMLNGKPMYQFGKSYPIVKCNSGEEGSYYLDLALAGINLKEGDIITISDEFRFYINEQHYVMKVIPVNLLFTKNQITEVKNIRSTLYNKVTKYTNPEDYDEEGLESIEQIVSNSESALFGATSMKELWSLYYDFLAQLDAVPYKESKQQEILENAKVKATMQLEALADPLIYDEPYYSKICELVYGKDEEDGAIDEVEAALSVSEVEQIVNDTIEIVSEYPTKQQDIEERIYNSDDLEEISVYLEDYEVVTTSDVCATDGMTFHDVDQGSYHTGGYDDITARIPTSSRNPYGNMIFQFTYESDDPSARIFDKNHNEFGAQIFIRTRGADDKNAYRFDIATITGNEFNSGLALTSFKNDYAIDRISYDAQLQPNVKYKIECGTIDLKGFDRTLLFMKLDDEMVLKMIVDSLEKPQPTIAIRDSYVADPHEAKISPVEEGTTKSKYYSSLIGKLELNQNASSSNALVASLRENNIPTGTELYPAEKGAFTLNDEEIEMVDSRPGARITKTGDDRYVISVSQHEYVDGDKITIDGYFSSLNVITLEKTIYRLLKSTFTYDSESNTWSQDAPTNQEIVSEAIQTIRYHADQANYSEESIQILDSLISKYVEEVENVPEADIPTKVPSIVDEAIKEIESVSTLLDEYKIVVIRELAEYRSKEDYRKEEQLKLAQILDDAYVAINACNDFASVNEAIAQAEEKIDDLKTSAQRDAEDLVDAKKAAYNEVTKFSGYIQLDRYSEENAEQIISLTYAVVDEGIKNASSIKELNDVVKAYKKAVKKVKTKDGTKFDGRSYVSSNSGCGGSIETVSLLSFVALFAAAALIIVKKLKEN